jgi:hypothetical protein
MTTFPPAARRMTALVTGLDHEVRLAS